jgi:hypothetical protein
MLQTSGELQQLDQQSVVKRVPSVKRVPRHRHHRSIKTNKNSTEPQTSNIIHVTIRDLENKQSNNDKSVNPSENLLAVRYYLKSSTFCSFLQFHQF